MTIASDSILNIVSSPKPAVMPIIAALREGLK
jgi:hypothetical protein